MHNGLNRINHPGSMFGGAVSMPGVPLLEIPVREMPDIPVQTLPPPAKQQEKAVSLSGLVLGRLTDLHPASEELKLRLSDMIGETAGLLAEADALEQECHAERRSLLEARHAEIKRQGRQQTALIKRLEKSFAEANQFWNMAKEAKGERQADLEQRIENQKGLGQWASKREEADAASSVADAKAALAAAIEKDAQALQRYNAAASAFASAEATLTQWSKQEERVRSELAGLPYFDPEFGLASK